MGKAIETYAIAEELLLQDAAGNRKEALADIFDRFYKPVYNYIRYRIDDPHEAEDIACQVFEQVMRKIDSYDPDRAPFEVWIFAIARNAVNDFHRRRKFRSWFSLEKAAAVVSCQPGPEEKVVRKEEIAKLLNALNALGARERDIIAMKFAGGLRNRDIAELTGQTAGNVGVILYRSLHRLRELLEREAVNNE